MEDLYELAANKIIKEQELIIGPVALEQAKKVSGLKVDSRNNKVELEGNKTEVLQSLVEQYQVLFGQTSVEVCKEAVSSLFAKLPKDQIPALLR